MNLHEQRNQQALEVIWRWYWGYPTYRVWEQGMTGQAELKRAEQNRQIKIESAKANLEAEKLNAMSEIERAKGMAEAMMIENGALSEDYIRYLWVRKNDFNRATTIYIPTEAGLPLMESTRKMGEHIDKHNENTP